LACMLRARASGFLLKNAPPEELVHAVSIVAAGDALLAPSVTRRVIEQYAQLPAPPRDDPGLDWFTERDAEVLRLLATGKSNAELATHLYLGEGTIKTHVSHLLAKLGLRDRSKRSRSPTRAVSSNPANPDSRAILAQLLVSQRPRPAWHHVAGQRRRRAHHET